MSADKQNMRIKDTQRSERGVLQPLAIALVCLVFIVLFLVMAVMNLKALDKTLTHFMENKGLTVIKNVQQFAESFLQQLAQTPRTFWDSDLGAPLDAEAVSLRESFLLDLMDLAQAIDFREATDRLSPKQLQALAIEEYLKLIAFLDERGRIELANRAVQKEIRGWANPVVQGSQTFKIDGLNPSLARPGRVLVALRRKSGQGAVVLALEGKGLRNRKARYSVQTAIDEMVTDSDLAYVILLGPHGQILRRIGQIPASIPESKESNPGLRVSDGVRSRRILAAGQNMQEIAAPIYLEGELSGEIRLGLVTTVTDRILKENRRNIFISTAFMVLVTCLAMWLLYKSQNRYLDRMRQMERRVYQAEKLSALGRLAAGVAHEIRNPLNAISLATQRLQRDAPHELTGVIRDEIRRLDQIIEEFLSISRSRAMKFRRYDLRELLQQIKLLIAEEAETRGVSIETRWPQTPCLVAMDVDKMKQSLLNIIKNAIESISGPGFIRLAVKSDNQGGFSVQVEDTGAGLHRDQIGQIFDLDYTTKEKGLGFGLALAHEIIRGHGGDIRVTSQTGRGTLFDIQLPRMGKAIENDMNE